MLRNGRDFLMVKIYNPYVSKYEPVGEMVARVRIWNQDYGASYIPNSYNYVDLANRVEIKFDDFEELKAYQYSINHLVDSLEKMLYNKREESVDLFKERVN